MLNGHDYDDDDFQSDSVNKYMYFRVYFKLLFFGWGVSFCIDLLHFSQTFHKMFYAFSTSRTLNHFFFLIIQATVFIVLLALAFGEFVY